MDDELIEEPVECVDCESTPELYYVPASDAELQLRCDCDGHSVDVSDTVMTDELFEPMAGKWSNFDYDSEMRGQT